MLNRLGCGYQVVWVGLAQRALYHLRISGDGNQ